MRRAAPALASVLLLALLPGGVAQCEACMPIADAGDDRMVVEGTTVRLQGSHEGPANVTYEWAQVAGPVVVLQDATTRGPSFVAPYLTDGIPVDLLFRLQVVPLADPQNRSRPDYVAIHVVAPDAGPVADAGDPQTVLTGATVVLDGTGSLGIEGRTLSFEWSQIVRPDDVFVDLRDNRTPQATFVAPDQPGQLHFRLRVGDGFGVSEDEAVVIVRAAATPPQPTFTFRLERVPGGAVVTFEAAAHVPVAQWDFGDASPRVDGTVVTHRYQPGNYTVTMYAGPGGTLGTAAKVVTVPPSELASTSDGQDWLVWVVAGVGVAAFTGLAILVRVRGRKGAKR